MRVFLHIGVVPSREAVPEVALLGEVATLEHGGQVQLHDGVFRRGVRAPGRREGAAGHTSVGEARPQLAEGGGNVLLTRGVHGVVGRVAEYVGQLGGVEHTKILLDFTAIHKRETVQIRISLGVGDGACQSAQPATEYVIARDDARAVIVVGERFHGVLLGDGIQHRDVLAKHVQKGLVGGAIVQGQSHLRSDSQHGHENGTLVGVASQDHGHFVPCAVVDGVKRSHGETLRGVVQGDGPGHDGVEHWPEPGTLGVIDQDVPQNLRNLMINGKYHIEGFFIEKGK